MKRFRVQNNNNTTPQRSLRPPRPPATVSLFIYTRTFRPLYVTKFNDVETTNYFLYVDTRVYYQQLVIVHCSTRFFPFFDSFRKKKSPTVFKSLVSESDTLHTFKRLCMVHAEQPSFRLLRELKTHLKQ